MADGDPEDTELELTDPVEPEVDLEDEGTNTDEQEPSREDSTDDRTDEQPVAAQEQVRPQERQPSRGESRFQRQQNENVRLNSELAETRRRLDELTSRVNQPPQPAETPEQRAARHALMTPEERMNETLRESQTRMERFARDMQFQTAESMDRAQFQAKCAVDPLYAKWAPKVEGKVAELRTKGQVVEREVALKFLIGEAALERRGSPQGKREVAQAKQRVQRATTRPMNSGGDTQAQRRQTSSVEKRLENVQI